MASRQLRRFAVTVSVDEVDLVSGLAWLAGVAGVEERDGSSGVELLVTTDDEAGLRGALPGRTVIERHGDNDEWVERWKPWARAVEVGDLVVAPPWVALDPADRRRVVRIDPGRAWGHGAHPTTRLVIEWLVAHPPLGLSVCDVGCGSGVLAIVAGALGAATVTAFDPDPAAVDATNANALANGLDLAVACGALGTEIAWPPHGVSGAGADDARSHGVSGAGADDGRSNGVSGAGADDARDLVVANLDAAVTAEFAPSLVGLVAVGGTLVLSGMLDRRAPSIAAVIASAEPTMSVISTSTRDGWTSIEFCRAAQAATIRAAP